jgi:hypothetical protein
MTNIEEKPETKEETKPTAEFNRTPISYRLDRLYGKNIRCPYCGTKIPKFVSACKNCGITKVQIAESIVKKRNAKNNRTRLWSKVRPADLPFWKIALASLFGFTGAHCFLTKRWIRGAYILVCIVAMFTLFFVFPFRIDDEAEAVVAHPVRFAFDNVGLAMPQDVFGVSALCLWVWDFFAIMFGWFKYPVFVNTENEGNGGKIQAAENARRH